MWIGKMRKKNISRGYFMIAENEDKQYLTGFIENEAYI